MSNLRQPVSLDQAGDGPDLHVGHEVAQGRAKQRHDLLRDPRQFPVRLKQLQLLHMAFPAKMLTALLALSWLAALLSAGVIWWLKSRSRAARK